MVAMHIRRVTFGVGIMAVLLALAAQISGCREGVRPGRTEAGTAARDQAVGTTRIVVTFRVLPASLDAAFVGVLARDAGDGLRYVRQLAGDQCLFEIDGGDSERIIRRLEKRSDILAVEPDRKLRHQR
ncbi:MAG TPA: hypothetical protein VGA00_04365 [Acidiferrobacterales bacterium]